MCVTLADAVLALVIVYIGAKIFDYITEWDMRRQWKK
jgi:hypothetical protein